MQLQNYKFNFSSWKDIPLEKYEKNFTFIVDGKIYETSRIIADILSPFIREHHFVDQTFDKLYIYTYLDPKDIQTDYFSEILSFVKCQNLTVSDENRLNYYANILLALGNTEEASKFYPQLNDKISSSNVFKRIQTLNKFYNKFHISTHQEYGNQSMPEFDQESIKNEINYISSHFAELDKAEIEKLDPYIIESIITNKRLQLDDEDTLLNFLLDVYKKNKKSSFLFENVVFSNITNVLMNKFIDTFDLNDINSTIWSSICGRLVKTSDGSFGERDRYQKKKYEGDDVIVFENENDKSLNGIFKYLTNKTNGNIHENGTIKITTNSNSDPNIYHPKNLVDFESCSYYDSKGDPGEKIICFDFKDYLVKVTDYTIKAINNSSYSPKSWRIEISDDGQNWMEIDKRTECHSLQEALAQATLHVRVSDFARFVRFKHEGPDWNGHNDISIGSIEFYGSLKLPDP